jgi:hypothetical protein
MGIRDVQEILLESQKDMVGKPRYHKEDLDVVVLTLPKGILE